MSQVKVKFINKDKSLFYPVLKDQIEAYFKDKSISKTGGARIVFKAVFMLALYIIPYLLILSNQFSNLAMFLMAIIMGIGVSGVGMGVMHDANHGSFSNNSTINKIFGGTLFLLGGHVYNWKVQHNTLHHTYTNIHELDEDITGKFLLRLSYSEKIKSIHKYQHLYAFFLYGLMTFSFLFKDFKQIFKYNSEAKNNLVKPYPKEEIIKMIISKTIYFTFILALPLILVDISFWEWLLGFFIMHFTAGLIMSTVFQLAHIVEGVSQPVPDFRGNIENAWALHQMDTTANFSGNGLISWFVGGLDYQIEHHLFPNISHIHYKEISAIVKKTAVEFNVSYNSKPSFSKAVVSHIKMLKTLGSAS